MRALLQRVSEARVRVNAGIVGEIGVGILVFVGVGHGDDETTADWVAKRVVDLRIFRDEAGKTNRSLIEVSGGALVVSQFTLHADTSRGRRPGFTNAAAPDLAERLYERVADQLRAAGVEPVATGQFGAEMAVELVNDGPFTLWLDSDAPKGT